MGLDCNCNNKDKYLITTLIIMAFIYGQGYVHRRNGSALRCDGGLVVEEEERE